MTKPRLLIKLSGEMLAGGGPGLFEQKYCSQLAAALVELNHQAEIALVIGGGNIIRGEQFKGGVPEVTAHEMGMLGTIINGFYLRELIQQAGGQAEVWSSWPMPAMAKTFQRQAVVDTLSTHLAILVAGTGHPFFSTDTCAALRAAELGCSLLLKGTKVDGVYDRDPQSDPAAVRLETLSLSEAAARNLKVMDNTAFQLCAHTRIPVKVFSVVNPQTLVLAPFDDKIGTTLTV